MTQQGATSDKQNDSPWAHAWAWLDTGAAAVLILALILGVGAYLRLSHINWDMETHIHPDERFLTMVSERLKLPASLGEYFDSTKSPLNPYNIRDGNGNMQFPLYVYGNLPLTIVRVAAEIANKFNQAAHLWTTEGDVPLDLTVYWGIHYVGRALSGLFDLAGVLVLYFIARRLYGRRAGLLAALLLAFTVLPLQQAHFFTADTFATFFSLVTFYFTIQVALGGRGAEAWNEALATGSGPADAEAGDGAWARSGGWLSYLAMGLSLGATLACRINLAPLAGICLLAIGMRAWREWRWEYRRGGGVNGGDGQPVNESSWLGFLLQATLFRVILFGLAAILAFRVFMPYAFGGTSVLDFSFADHWRDNMREIQQLISGAQDYPPGHQWTTRTPFVFPFVNMVIWGMGLPLGLAGWAGFLLAFWQIARSLTRPAYLPLARLHLLPVTWVGGMFLWQGLQFVQSMRYLLPIYPMLCMFAAWLLWWLVERAAELRAADGVARTTGGSLAGRLRARLAGKPILSYAAYGLLAAVTVGTLLWGWGFLAIYRRPLSRVTASRWIYQNIPPGSHIGNEHWDDQLPLGIDGRSAYKPCGPYEGLSSSSDGLMQMYGEDTPEKRELLYRWLDEADYIVLSSNRLWASIPRLPLRYPMTSLYYKLLFEGKLGFKQVLKVSSFPTIFGIPFDDSSAEEAFSVYDHPVVYIFQKTPEYSDAKMRAYFDGVDLENTVQIWPKQASKAPTALLLTAVEAVRQQAGGTWTAIFNENSLANRVPVLVWLVLLELLGLIGFLILFAAMPGLSDRGYAFAKTFAILALAWLSWVGPSLKVVPYARGLIAAMLVLLAVVASLLAWRNRPALVRFWRARRSLLLTEEALFLALFALFLLIRWGNPDLWHPARGGEKPMDFAYLNAVIRSTTFPPYDPWFAGGFINYYYFGFVMIGSLIKLTGIVPAVAYNLAVPSLFALTGLGAFGVAYNLFEGDAVDERRLSGHTEPVAGFGLDAVREPLHPAALFAGLAAMVFVAVAGNLGEVKLLADQWAAHSPVQLQSTIPGFAGLVQAMAGGLAWLLRIGPGREALQIPNDWWFWNASRVIPDTINEFPFFTFTYADLHAHMIAFPLTLLALGAAVALVRGARAALPAGPSPWRIGLTELALLVLLGFTIGALRATNTWDFPTYILVALAALAVVESVRWARGRPGAGGLSPGRHIAWRAPMPAEVPAAVAEAGTAPSLADTLALGEPNGAAPADADGHGSNNGAADLEPGGRGGLPEGPAWAPAAAQQGGPGSPNADELSPWQAELASLARAVVSVVWRLLLVLAVASIAFYPYTRSYATAYTGLQGWHDATTSLGDYLIVNGFFLTLITIYLISELVVQMREDRLAGWLDEALPFVLAAVVVLVGVGWVFKARTWLIAAPLLILALVLALGRDLSPTRRLALLLMALGLCITMGVEVVRLQDDIGRMNTVFKFYLQAWIIFGISAAFGTAHWVERARDWTPGWRRLAQAMAIVLFVGVMLYPALAARAKVADRFSAEDQPRGLDGTAFMSQARFFDQNADLNLAADKAAITWMLHNVPGSPVILEGNSPSYRWGNRFSIYTGLPSVMGWDYHERQQRSIVPPAMIDRRLQHVHELYTTPDVARTQTLLDYYHVKYIIVGELERAYYGPTVQAKFDGMVDAGRLKVVYDQGGVTIYEVTPKA